MDYFKIWLAALMVALVTLVVAGTPDMAWAQDEPAAEETVADEAPAEEATSADAEETSAPPAELASEESTKAGADSADA